MKNLKSLSKEELVSEIKRLVKEELRIGLEVLEYLREIEARKIYLERGYSSLFAFCVSELSYSEPQAQLRIDAMRALRDTPEIETKVRSGELNVSNVAKVQRFLRKERARTGISYSPAARLDLFAKAEGKSTRDVERELIKISPESVLPKERERPLSETRTELRLVISDELHHELKSLQALYSHRMKDPNSMTELLALLARDALRRSGRASRSDAAKNQAAKLDQNVAHIAPKVDGGRSRYIPATIRREIWNRDEGQCTYTEPKTGRKCGSTHYLQIDHVLPFSLNGATHDPAELRLYCGAHNRHAWEQVKRELGPL